MSRDIYLGKYMELGMDFPLCNHTQGIGPENVGYQTGVMDDGQPFEVEVYTYGDGDEKMSELALIMPDIYVEEDDLDDDMEDNEDGLEADKSNVIGFSYEVEMKDYSVLPIGMVVRGQETSFPIIKWYVDYIEEMGIVEFLGDVRGGSVFYYTDANGNDLVQVRVNLISNGKEEGRMHFSLRQFMQTYRNEFKVLK